MSKRLDIFQYTVLYTIHVMRWYNVINFNIHKYTSFVVQLKPTHKMSENNDITL